MSFIHVHRLDKNNVGDVFCAPYRYFDLKSSGVFDIKELPEDLSSFSGVVLGGGGLGTRFFNMSLHRLQSRAESANIPVIVWGAGVDVIKNRHGGVVSEDQEVDIFGNFYDGFTVKGIRSFSEDMPEGYTWVPCVSCMHKELERYREQRPTRQIGYYVHKSVRNGIPVPDGSNVELNTGADLATKLGYIAAHEYIITNTYHGVYWATLLNRKVICVPFKSGLLSFKHKPTYVSDWTIGEDVFDQTRSYPDSLEECCKV